MRFYAFGALEARITYCINLYSPDARYELFTTTMRKRTAPSKNDGTRMPQMTQIDTDFSSMRINLYNTGSYTNTWT
jgi:hypothetical protein